MSLHFLRMMRAKYRGCDNAYLKKNKKTKKPFLFYPFLSHAEAAPQNFSLQFCANLPAIHSFTPLLCMWSEHQQHLFHPGACQRCRVSGSSPDPLNQSLQFNQIPRWFQCRRFETHSLIHVPLPSSLTFFIRWINLVSHQPERIPPLQREGDELRCQLQGCDWRAEREDIRTSAC